MMSPMRRVVRHSRITGKGFSIPTTPMPSFVIFFISSICNLKCGHCFYWRQLNHGDDLTVEEIFVLADDLGRIENLNLSGGEPFMRKELAEICRYFVRRNGVRQIYVPTNATFTRKTVEDVAEVLKEPALEGFTVEISLDGMPGFHNRLRGSGSCFERAMETYEALAELQKKDSRLRIHAVSTANRENLEEIRHLTRFLNEKCPAMEHHNIALIRGDAKDPSFLGPDLDAYQELHAYSREVWAQRENGRFGGIVEPLLQWAKMETATRKRQVVPCRAGVLSAVVYANGDVGFCESLPSLGNLRQSTFRELWFSKKAVEMRESIWMKECHCTNEIFLWPSVVFNPWHLTRALWHTRLGRRKGGYEGSL
jgi:MoaA/NifB/PqqE/SkfB family radical SAM enzyme